MASDDLVLDLTNYKDTVGNYVDPGPYVVVIEDAELGESSRKHTPELTLWLRVVGGEFDGATIVEHIYRTEGSTFRMVAFLAALGIPTPKKKLQFKLRQFTGRRLRVVMDDDNFGDRKRSRVVAFERYIAPAGATEEPDLDGLNEFAGTDAEAVDLPDEAPEAAPAVAPRPAAKKPAPVVDEAEDEVEPPIEEEPDPEPLPTPDDAEVIDLDDMELS